MEDGSKTRSETRRAFAVQLCLLAACLLAVTGAGELTRAQDATRRGGGERARAHKVRGNVRDARGKPVVGAVVHGVTRPLGPILDSGPTQRVRAETDARGRFTLPVREGHDYSVWAEWSGGNEDGKSWTSQVQDCVRERQLLRLRLGAEPRARIHVAIEGLDKWKHRAPLRFFALDPAPLAMVRSELTVGADGRALLPQVTSNGAWIEIDGKDGLPIFQAIVAPPSGAATRDKPLRVRVAPPRTVRVLATVRSGTNKQRVVGPALPPIQSGATVYFGRNPSRHPLQRVGELDAQGRFEIELAISESSTDDVGIMRSNDLKDTVFVVSGEKHADAYANLSRTGGTKAKDGAFELRFELADGHTVRGRIMWDAERPVANAVLLHYASLCGVRGGGQVACTPRRVPCDADGRFVLRGQNPNYPFRLTWLPSAADREALSSGDYPAGAEHLLCSMSVDKAGTNCELGDIRVDQLVRLDIDALGADASPLAYPHYQIMESAQNSNATNRAMSARGNRRGAVRFLCPAKSEIGIWMACASGFAERAHSAKESAKVQLALDARRRMTGQVFMASNAARPLADGMLWLDSLGTSQHKIRGRLMSARRLGGILRRATVPLTTVARQQIRMRVWGFFGAPEPPIPCNAEGRFEVFLPAEHKGMSFVSFGSNERGKRVVGTRIPSVVPDADK